DRGVRRAAAPQARPRRLARSDRDAARPRLSLHAFAHAVKRSLVTRVLFAAGAAMLVFLALTITALDVAFRRTAERAIEERLQMQVRALISEAGQDVDGHLIMPQQLP